ncbi:MAG TPA: hypothetical protein VK196_19630 [Magnetospirillum sp.]|nr:hypothetical protein [Magnetospirillum sp.]
MTDADYANFRAPMMSMEIIAAKLPSDDSGCALLQARIAHMQQGIHPEVDPDFIRVWDASQTERWGKLLSDLHESVEETAKPYQCKKGMAKLRGSY